MKCLRKIFSCRTRDPYAEVYSQAYSLSFIDDNYLAKQKQVPASTSNLSSEASFVSSTSQGEFSEVVTSVDLLQIGTEHEENQRTKREENAQKPLAFMAMRTVTSIEGQDTGDYDIETLLETNENSRYQNATDQANEGFTLDPMDYHEVSKICAKSKRHFTSKTRVAPFMRTRKQKMKNRTFEMIHEDVMEGEDSFHSKTSEESPAISFPPHPEAEFAPQVMIIRNISSCSTPYLEGNTVSI
mmetsp:Transcript_21879/g.36130  ORF Transcript_21879/g.36130 Transcript_21879/m.36130 type:complete len:242 (+) Transcript_21879:89-814(+)|eukprot:CAMPEP_0119004046 /NCGR_PEP_ID=MMETSP1176-20130426/919_1 /TAXON_ID=265551 /ORGANISM="Synedropsis recta cf, Strain CCMP1620" /LENGTH=241 /DNA_ID=CAMNT_0006955709 /DNA_START=86 /DNA_END=811 /DNA_ORIENTATION=-